MSAGQLLLISMSKNLWQIVFAQVKSQMIITFLI